MHRITSFFPLWGGGVIETISKIDLEMKCLEHGSTSVFDFQTLERRRDETQLHFDSKKCKGWALPFFLSFFLSFFLFFFLSFFLSFSSLFLSVFLSFLQLAFCLLLNLLGFVVLKNRTLKFETRYVESKKFRIYFSNG